MDYQGDGVLLGTLHYIQKELVLWIRIRIESGFNGVP
jgi:hypothetical protein